MREIIFRGKRTDNGEWAEGYLYEHEPALVVIVSENDVPEPSKWFIARTGFADWNMPRPVEIVEVDPSTVGQYTGLLDKNGKRIFEGDVLTVDGEVGCFELKFNENTAMFIMDGDAIRASFNIFGTDEVEVIGNIHDGGLEFLSGGEEE